MKFLIKSLFLLAFFGSALSGLAQIPDSLIDKKTKHVIKKVAKRMDHYSALKSSITIVANRTDGTVDTSNLDVFIKANKYKMIWHRKGIIDEYYDDGVTNAYYSSKRNEVELDSSNNLISDDSTFSPVTFFKICKKGFRYTFAGQDTSNGKVVERIDLTPLLNRSKKYALVSFYIDKKSNCISKICVHFISGYQVTYFIDSFWPNEEIPDDTFLFNQSQHPGVKTGC
ncbi:MAG TPA: hypothetical protein VL651_01300 [Bacteroidia bacterium]|jgi:outer membrane lipoprotein-sorting protein|nr:hypothetical protein [Bacteroidia bacterium]